MRHLKLYTLIFYFIFNKGLIGMEAQEDIGHELRSIRDSIPHHIIKMWYDFHGNIGEHDETITKQIENMIASKKSDAFETYSFTFITNFMFFERRSDLIQKLLDSSIQLYVKDLYYVEKVDFSFQIKECLAFLASNLSDADLKERVQEILYELWNSSYKREEIRCMINRFFPFNSSFDNLNFFYERLSFDTPESNSNIGIVVDLDRLLYLYQIGGIYLDLDIHITNPSKYFEGVDASDICTAQFEDVGVNNDYLACKSGSPIILDYILTILANCIYDAHEDSCTLDESSAWQALETSGPYVWQGVLESFKESNFVIHIHPPTIYAAGGAASNAQTLCWQQGQSWNIDSESEAEDAHIFDQDIKG